MFFVVRSNDRFNFPLGWIKYIVTVVISDHCFSFKLKPWSKSILKSSFPSRRWEKVCEIVTKLISLFLFLIYIFYDIKLLIFATFAVICPLVASNITPGGDGYFSIYVRVLEGHSSGSVGIQTNCRTDWEARKTSMAKSCSRGFGSNTLIDLSYTIACVQNKSLYYTVANYTDGWVYGVYVCIVRSVHVCRFPARPRGGASLCGLPSWCQR